MFYYKYAQVISEFSSILVVFHRYKKELSTMTILLFDHKTSIAKEFKQGLSFPFAFCMYKTLFFSESLFKKTCFWVLQSTQKIIFFFFITITNFQEQELWTFSKRKIIIIIFSDSIEIT